MQTDDAVEVTWCFANPADILDLHEIEKPERYEFNEVSSCLCPSTNPDANVLVAGQDEQGWVLF